MKKSSFITMFIIFLAASLIIAIGCFTKNPKKSTEEQLKETEVPHILGETIPPIESDDPGATEENPNATKEAPENTPAPSGKPEDNPTATPGTTAKPSSGLISDMPFATIKNADFDKYSNKFSYISTTFSDAQASQQAESVMSSETKEALKGIKYVYTTNENDSDTDVYITFALHYESGYTEKILDTLKEHNVKALFFVSLLYMQENPDIVKRMVNEGHLIGNRGLVGEEALNDCTAESFAEGLMAVEKEYQKLFGADKRTYYYRSDYFSPRTMRVAEALGYTIVVRTYSIYQTFKIYGEDYDRLAWRLNERGLYRGSVDEFNNEKLLAEALPTFLQYGEDEKVNFKLIKRIN